MKTYQFHGYLDDGFHEVGVTNHSQGNCADGTVMQYEIVMPDGSGVRVTGAYDCGNMGRGCWMIGVEALDEYKPIDWLIVCSPSYSGYYGMMTITAPDEARLCACYPRHEPAGAGQAGVVCRTRQPRPAPPHPPPIMKMPAEHTTCPMCKKWKRLAEESLMMKQKEPKR